MTENRKIIYYGNPEFAVAPLELLVKKGFQVTAVVCSPDKPAGRGLKLQKPAVKIAAEKLHLPVLQPEKLSDPVFIEQIRQLDPALQIVIAFKKLPAEIWKTSNRGTINLHPSLLPDYRGAAPLNWVLINGEQETGITTIFINDHIDCGDIILQEKFPVSPDDNAGTLHDKLSSRGSELIAESAELIFNDKAAVKRQPFDKSLKKAPKITKEMCRIDWHKTALEINNLVRGLSPSPGAWTLLDQKIFKILRCKTEISARILNPGQIFTDHKTFVKIESRNGLINLRQVQLEGRKAMDIEEFLKGYHFADNGSLI